VLVLVVLAVVLVDVDGAVPLSCLPVRGSSRARMAPRSGVMGGASARRAAIQAIWSAGRSFMTSTHPPAGTARPA